MKLDVAIITGWSNIGGSTESYINLTNALNNEGIKTKLFGPHQWHLDKCDGEVLPRLNNYDPTNIIWHFLPMNHDIERHIAPVNNILSCHEHEINKVFERYNIGIFNKLHFFSEEQKQYHLNYSGNDDDETYVVIPNLIDPTLKASKVKPDRKVGGVIGSIDRNKQTHVAIQNALNDGCELVRVFGDVTDVAYNYEYVRPLLGDPRVLYHGVVDSKSEMYASVTDVYHYSIKETWGYIKAECEILEIPFHSNNQCQVMTILSNEEIIRKWQKLII